MRPASTDFGALIRLVLDGGVECILVGGVAANVHGAARATYDVDLVYRRTPDNIDRIVQVLAPIRPYLRGAPPGLPFVFDADTMRRGLNFTLITSLGEIDLLGEVTGGGGYDALLASTETVHLFDRECRVVTLGALIHLKRASGRPKDLEAIAELEALSEERDGRDRP